MGTEFAEKLEERLTALAEAMVASERKRWEDRLQLLVRRYEVTAARQTYVYPEQVVNNLKEIIEDLTK